MPLALGVIRIPAVVPGARRAIRRRRLGLVAAAQLRRLRRAHALVVGPPRRPAAAALRLPLLGRTRLLSAPARPAPADDLLLRRLVIREE
jgi:hypothetical protein